MTKALALDILIGTTFALGSAVLIIIGTFAYLVL